MIIELAEKLFSFSCQFIQIILFQLLQAGIVRTRITQMWLDRKKKTHVAKRRVF